MVLPAGCDVVIDSECRVGVYAKAGPSSQAIREAREECDM